MSALPLRIDDVATPHGGRIGLLHCPGRCGGSYGTRDLRDDFAAVEAWGADILLSLVEGHEFVRLGVPQFAIEARTRSFRWLHAPIPDFSAPGDDFGSAWVMAGPLVAATLDQGGQVAMHCAAGLGRTGTLAAKLLADLGVAPDDAIARVRHARPGTIETAAQAAFVRTSARLLP